MPGADQKTRNNNTKESVFYFISIIMTSHSFNGFVVPLDPSGWILFIYRHFNANQISRPLKSLQLEYNKVFWKSYTRSSYNKIEYRFISTIKISSFYNYVEFRIKGIPRKAFAANFKTLSPCCRENLLFYYLILFFLIFDLQSN